MNLLFIQNLCYGYSEPKLLIYEHSPLRREKKFVGFWFPYSRIESWWLIINLKFTRKICSHLFNFSHGSFTSHAPFGLQMEGRVRRVKIEIKMRIMPFNWIPLEMQMRWGELGWRMDERTNGWPCLSSSWICRALQPGEDFSTRNSRAGDPPSTLVAPYKYIQHTDLLVCEDSLASLSPFLRWDQIIPVLLGRLHIACCAECLIQCFLPTQHVSTMYTCIYDVDMHIECRNGRRF